MPFHSLTSTFTPTISTWSFYCDFEKVEKNTFAVKLQLNILNTLLGESDVEQKFLEIVKNYPEVREVLPILLAVRDPFQLIFDAETKQVLEVKNLFHKSTKLSSDDEITFLRFFRDSGLKNIFENHKITNLNDYVFWVEAGLNSNARKNRSGTQMETLVENMVKDFCERKWYQYKEQANAKWIENNWGVEIQSDKAKRRYDYVIYNGKEVFLIETNFYGWGGSKLKAVAGEFSGLYKDMKNQWIKFFWITDGSVWWNTSLRPLEDAYNIMEWNIYNISMLNNGILDKIIG